MQEIIEARNQWQAEQDRKAKIGDIIAKMVLGFMFCCAISVIVAWSQVL